jgi:hypothetical protein
VAQDGPVSSGPVAPVAVAASSGTTSHQQPAGRAVAPAPAPVRPSLPSACCLPAGLLAAGAGARARARARGSRLAALGVVCSCPCACAVCGGVVRGVVVRVAVTAHRGFWGLGLVCHNIWAICHGSLTACRE